MEKEEQKRNRFCINDHRDILAEILCHLDGKSLGIAACVCRQWNKICQNDSIWETLCKRHVSEITGTEEVKAVVMAMGGFRRLYMVCVRPVQASLSRQRKLLGCDSVTTVSSDGRDWRKEEVQLSLSLFSVDCYERIGGRNDDSPLPSSCSLMFLFRAVNA